MRPSGARLLDAAGEVLDRLVPLGRRSARIVAVLTWVASRSGRQLKSCEYL